MAGGARNARGPITNRPQVNNLPHDNVAAGCKEIKA